MICKTRREDNLTDGRLPFSILCGNYIYVFVMSPRHNLNYVGHNFSCDSPLSVLLR